MVKTNINPVCAEMLTPCSYVLTADEKGGLVSDEIVELIREPGGTVCNLVLEEQKEWSANGIITGSYEGARVRNNMEALRMREAMKEFVKSFSVGT
jgi:hypothetical protein